MSPPRDPGRGGDPTAPRPRPPRRAAPGPSVPPHPARPPRRRAGDGVPRPSAHVLPPGPPASRGAALTSERAGAAPRGRARTGPGRRASRRRRWEPRRRAGAASSSRAAAGGAALAAAAAAAAAAGLGATRPRLPGRRRRGFSWLLREARCSRGKLFRTQSRRGEPQPPLPPPPPSSRLLSVLLLLLHLLLLLPSAPAAAAAGRVSPGRTPGLGRDPAWATHPARRTGRWTPGPPSFPGRRRHPRPEAATASAGLPGTRGGVRRWARGRDWARGGGGDVLRGKLARGKASRCGAAG